MVLKRAADLAEAIYAVPTTQHRGITDYSRYGAAVSNVSSVANNVHEAVSAAGGHGYNEAVEDYNRAQHNSSSSPSRGYTNGLFFTFTARPVFVKFSFSEKATKKLKKSPTCFDGTG